MQEIEPGDSPHLCLVANIKHKKIMIFPKLLNSAMWMDSDWTVVAFVSLELVISNVSMVYGIS
jgi:hypothetical protein